MIDLASIYTQLSTFMDDFGQHGLSQELIDLLTGLGFEAQAASDIMSGGEEATDFVLFDDRADALNMGYTRRLSGDLIRLDYWVKGEVVASKQWSAGSVMR